MLITAINIILLLSMASIKVLTGLKHFRRRNVGQLTTYLSAQLVYTQTNVNMHACIHTHTRTSAHAHTYYVLKENTHNYLLNIYLNPN